MFVTYMVSHRPKSSVCLHYMQCMHTNMSPSSLIQESGPGDTCQCVSYQEVLMDVECIVNQIFPLCLKMLFISKTIRGFWLTLCNQCVKWQVPMEEQCIIPPHHVLL